MFGIGLPTTCGYACVYGKNTKLQYIYGTYVQMFFSVKIRTNIIHHSFSWCFPHATAVPIAMANNGNILIYNDDSSDEQTAENDSYLCAWGSSGGSKHASARKL